MLISWAVIEGPAGGVGRFAEALCRTLARSGRDLRLFALWRHDPASEAELSARLAAVGVPLTTGHTWNPAQPYRSLAQSVQRLAPIMRSQAIGLLHSHHEFSDLAAAVLRMLGAAPRVVRTVHNEEWSWRPLARRLLSNTLYPLVFSKEAGVSQDIVDRLDARPIARGLRRRASLLHNAIDLSRFVDQGPDPSAARKLLGLSTTGPVIGSVGRLSEQKGYAYFLEAAALVLKQRPEANFVLIGEGELETTLRVRARDLGISGQVRLLGPRRDIEQLLGAMDIFVSSSLWEGLPTAVLESMAAGVPVIATAVTGTREILVNGKTGVLVPPRSPTDLATAILGLLDDAGRRREFSIAAQRRVQAFSIGEVAKGYEAFYADVLH